MSDREKSIASGGWFRNRLDRFRRGSSRAYPHEHLKRSALFFSPHFDDETLGCGGVIIKKKRAGADVKIVFMTDGSGSHRQLMSARDLASIRLREALDAAAVMGLQETDVVALGFEEQKLGQHHADAVQKVRDLLEHHCPAELWIPHSHEPLIWSSDHRETTRIIKQAARLTRQDFSIFEYPVWLWFTYPWIDLPGAKTGELRHLVKTSFFGACGFHLARSCHFEVDIEDVLEIKRAALAAHRSQMVRYNSDPAWPTLGDVANGQFLECFFQSHEIFAAGDLD